MLIGGTEGDEFAYLIDFGISRALSGSGTTSFTVTGATVGTLDYMAPERFLEGPLDGRVDVYSLACMLFETLTATKPFRGEGLPAMVHAHLNLEPPRPSVLQPRVPPALDDVVARGMAKDPTDRFASAGALAAAARSALAESTRSLAYQADAAPTSLGQGSTEWLRPTPRTVPPARPSARAPDTYVPPQWSPPQPSARVWWERPQIAAAFLGLVVVGCGIYAAATRSGLSGHIGSAVVGVLVGVVAVIVSSVHRHRSGVTFCLAVAGALLGGPIASMLIGLSLDSLFIPQVWVSALVMASMLLLAHRLLGTPATPSP